MKKLSQKSQKSLDKRLTDCLIRLFSLKKLKTPVVIQEGCITLQLGVDQTIKKRTLYSSKLSTQKQLKMTDAPSRQLHDLINEFFMGFYVAFSTARALKARSF
uniref:Uncharacterized protein n=1 Tax=Cacopsylla melanoneura TaxID=428564 RepID=A0A8D9EQK0_9HEMI